LAAERYDVRAEPEVSTDLNELAKIDDRLVERAIEILVQLREDPWIGEDLWQRYNMRHIADCRKIRFDLLDWDGKPRFRIVYRNEPLDGAPGLVRIWSIGPREKLIAYSRATVRITREQAQERRRVRR
jgi:hypothetical protein